MVTEKRRHQRLQSFEQALMKLDEAVRKRKYSDLEKAGLIKTFDFTFELAWKTLKDVLEYEGYDVKSPRDVIKQAFKSEYIFNGDGWLDILAKRNLMAHIYDEAMSDELINLIKTRYYPLLRDLYNLLKQKVTS